MITKYGCRTRYTAVSNPRFLSGQSIRDILLNTAILAVMAAGQAVVVITRNIDLSVGSVLGLSAFTVATVMSANPGLPILVALLVGLTVGGVAGLLNGVLVRYGRVPALVVTLGTLYIYRGITYSWAGGQQVNADELPRHLLTFANNSLLGIPWLVLIALIVVGGVSLLMRNYRTGRELYAIGSSPQAAELAGIKVARNLLGAFVLSGALAGLAGVLFAARFGTVDAAAGTGLELNVVAAVVVGGVAAVFGGSGTAWGAGLGALLLTVIGSSLAVLDINQFWQQAIVGALIVLAICADRLVAVRIARSLPKDSVSELKKRLSSWDSIIVLLTVFVLIVASFSVTNFGTSRNFTFLILDLLPIMLVALPMTFIIVTGEIDLSVASTLGLASSIMGYLWNQGFSIESIIPICIIVGAILGAINGFLVTGLGLPSLAVTIGTLALYRGLALVVLCDGAVADFPFSYTGWVTGTIGNGPVPNVLVLIVVLAVIFGVILHATPFGRSLYAIGANAQAAHFSGIRVARTKFWLYVVSGAVAGLVGVLWTLRYSSARADNGAGLELAVVAAVLLGGVSIFGGKGSLPGVLAGVVLLAALQNALRLQDVSGQTLNIVTGALLVLSVLLPNIATSLRTTWQRRKLRRAAIG